MKKGLFLILLTGLCGISASFLLSNPAYMIAFKPIGPLESTPADVSSQPSEQQSSFLDYENSTFGMRIAYPSNWTKYESQNGSSGLIVQFTDNPQAGINYGGEQSPIGTVAIKGTPFTLNSTTTDLSLWLQEQLKDFKNELPSFLLYEMKNMVINSNQQNIPGTMTSYTYEDPLYGKVDAFILDIYKDERAYSIEYSAEPDVYHKNLPILEKMIDSFEIFESPQTTMVIPASTRFSQYENGTMGIRIEYPDNWMYEEEGEGVTFGPSEGHFYVAKFPGANSTSEKASTNFINDLRQSFSGFNLILAESTNLPGANFTSSNLVIYTGSTEIGEIYKYMGIITVYNGNLYWIEYAADPKAYEIFEPMILQMINSFQIMDVTDAAAPVPTSTEDQSNIDTSFAEPPTHITEIMANAGDVTSINLFEIDLPNEDEYSPGLKWSIVRPPLHGALSYFNPHIGMMDYTPVPGFTGNDDFTFKFGNTIGLVSISVVQ